MQSEEYNWTICRNMKTIGLFLGQRDGYTKYLCFLFLWDSREKKWSLYTKDLAKQNGVQNWSEEFLNNSRKVLFPRSACADKAICEGLGAVCWLSKHTQNFFSPCLVRKLRQVFLTSHRLGGYCRASNFWRSCLALKKKRRILLLRLCLTSWGKKIMINLCTLC